MSIAAAWQTLGALLLAMALIASGCGDAEPQAVVEPEPQQQAAAPEEASEDASEDAPPPAQVSMDGATATFVGEMTLENAEEFVRQAEARDAAVTKLVINSGGGDVDAGRVLGRWVFRNQIDVVVEELCFSSCANYVFPAAPRKTIRAHAIVGWHGSDQQDRFIIEDDDDPAGFTCREQPLPEGADTGWDYSDEVAFLEEIGIAVDALVWGMMEPERCERYKTMQVDGWTFSIENMAKLGIGNVTYEGEGEYPSAEALEKYPVAVFAVE